MRFDNGVAWDTALQLSELNPAYWVAELPGSLAGPLRSQGSVRDERLALGVDLDVKGRLRGQPALFQARAEGEGSAGRWATSTCAWGITRFRAAGRSTSACKAAWTSP